MKRLNDKIKIYKDKHKKQLLLPNPKSEDPDTLTWDLSDEKQRKNFLSIKDNLWIEGYAVSKNSGDTGLQLTYRPIKPLSGGVLQDIIDTMKCTVVKVEKIKLIYKSFYKKFEGHKEWPFDPLGYPDPGKHIAIFYKDVIDNNFQVLDFDINMTASILPSEITDDDTKESWKVEKDPNYPPSGQLNKEDTFNVKFQNLKEGGVYKIKFTLMPKFPENEVNIVLPLAGAEVKGRIKADLHKAEIFAEKVNKKYSVAEKLLRTPKWFWLNGNGDYLGRPFNGSAMTCVLYNQMNDDGMGAVGTWFGKPIRVAKYSNFLYAYTMAKMGFSLETIISGEALGTVDKADTAAIYGMAYSLAHMDISNYEVVVRSNINNIWKLCIDDKHKKLWPNNVPVTSGLISPGFLDIEDP